MLKSVKAMILQKNEFLEAAQILFEENTETNLDNLIILGESADDLPKDKDDDEDDKVGGKDDDDDKGKKDDEDDDGDDLDGDLNNLPLDADDDDKDKGPEGNEDLLNSPIGDDDEIEPSLLGTDDLPPVAGSATGDPASDNIEEFLNITIDLRSNTITDVLPVPPDNAAEAIASDDILNTRVDAGFAEDAGGGIQAGGFPMEEDAEAPIEGSEVVKESVDSFLEAISMDGEAAPAEKPADGTEPPSDATIDAGAAEAPAAEGEGESEVTSAVRDKVSEADEPIEGGAMPNGKEELLKKLGSITKSLEDAKKAVMNTLQ